MNLRIGDPAGLVAFLHQAISTSGRTVLSTDGLVVVELRSRFFFHSVSPITVGGPFASLEDLVRSEGVRRYPEPADSAVGLPTREVFEWATSFFRIEGEGDDRVRRYPTLEEAAHG